MSVNRQEWLEQENERLRAIVSQTKRLLLSDELLTWHFEQGVSETDRLCELVERYEDDYYELPPQLAPHGKKSWYASLDKKGQVANLREILALSALSAEEE